MGQVSAPMRSRDFFLLVVLLCASTRAFAQDKTVAKHLATAARLHRSRAFDRALAQVKRAAKVETRTADDDLQILLYEGSMLAELDKRDEASAAFKKVLGMRPGAKLPLKASVKSSQLFDAASAEVNEELAKADEEKKQRDEAERVQRDAEEKQAQADQARARAVAPLKIAAPGFSQHGLTDTAGDFYADQLAQQLSFHGLEVVTRTQVSALIGLERQKELLGCHDESGSCAVEFAGALGTDGLMLGEAAKVGDQYRISLRIISAKNGEKLSSAVITGSSEDTVLEAFRKAAPRVAEETKQRARGASITSPGVSTERSGTKQYFWIPASIGVLGIGAGAFAYVQAKNRYDELRSSSSLVEPAPSRLRNEGQSFQTISLVGMAVGVAGFAAAGSVFALGSDATVEAGVVLAPGEVSIGLAGVLP